MKKINIIVACLALVCFTCSSDDNGNGSPEPVNQPPSGVVLISPTNNGIDKNVLFTYNVPDGDPDGDAIVYDIYLDNGTEELIIAENHNEETFVYDEVLGLNRNYTWRVVAKDGNGGETESETFSFKTRKANYEVLDANYIARQSHTTALFNNELIILGGGDAAGYVFNSRSSSGGVLWSPIPFIEERIYHTAGVFDNKLWVFGGQNEELLTSIYNISDISSGSEESWNEVENTEGLLPRIRHTQVVLNDNMYIIGGTVTTDGVVGASEVWSSPDGVAWAKTNENAPFGNRLAHTSVAFDNKIWVIAGSDGVDMLNDVWYSDNGTDWALATEHAGFTERVNHTSVVYDNKIWVYGGFGNDLNSFGDLWYSKDGVNWHEAKFETSSGTGELPVGLSSSSIVVKDDVMYVIGGRDNAGDYIDYIIKIQ